MRITHSAGHALTTPGKQSPDGYKEWQYTSKIVERVMSRLDNEFVGIVQKRLDDPTGKVDISLQKRSDAANAFKADVHIDYHLNAYGNGTWNNVGGTETFVYKSWPKEATELAKVVQANALNALKFTDRRVKAADFHMLRETNMTAILIEFAFMTNKDEAMKMRTQEYINKAADAVVDSLESFYKLKRKPKPAPKLETGKLYKVQVGAFAKKENADRLASELKKKGYATYIVRE